MQTIGRYASVERSVCVAGKHSMKNRKCIWMPSGMTENDDDIGNDYENDYGYYET